MPMTEDAEALDTLAAIEDYLREIASYNRRRELEEILDDPEHRTAYELSNGNRSASDIQQEGNISKSPRTIQTWWEKWVELDIAERLPNRKVRRRYDTFVLPTEDD